MKILVVDDEVIQLEMLKDAIIEVVPECELTGFANPLEALDWARENTPEIAFLIFRCP